MTIHNMYIILLTMSIRLQVLLDEEELEEIKKISGEERMTVSAWVRRAIQNEKKSHPQKAFRKKLAALNKAAEYHLPSGNIDEMIADIESGYGSGKL